LKRDDPCYKAYDIYTVNLYNKRMTSPLPVHILELNIGLGIEGMFFKVNILEV
jgi:hypothetical protein